MADEIPSVEIKENDARAAFEALKAALLALTKSALIPLRYSATEAVVRGLWVADHAVRDRSLFERVYREPPLDTIDGFRQSVLAVKGAELAEETPSRAAAPDIARVRELRNLSLLTQRAVFHGDATKQAELDQIEKGSGHRDLGSDGIALADLADQHWKAISATGLVTKEQNNELKKLSMQVLRWAGRREGTSQNESRLMEQRAWSQMVAAYNTIRDHAFVIYRNDKEVWQRDYPSLYAIKPPQ